MAPAATPGRKKRENNFFDVGVQGRKTGVTIPDRGIRDEYGMEPLDGIFSSPEKSSPVKRSSSRKTGTVTTSESMELQESSIPEPTETVQLLRSSKTKFPPPLGRSPIKTALGSSPRRQSSVQPKMLARTTTTSPERAGSYPAVSRRLDFSSTEEQSDVAPLTINGSLPRRGKNRKSVYDLPQSPIRSQAAFDDTILEEESIANGDTDDQANGIEDTYVGAIGDMSFEEQDGEDIGLGASNEEAMLLKEPAQRAKRGRKRKSDTLDSSQIEEDAPSTKARRAIRGGTRSSTGHANPLTNTSSTSQDSAKTRSKPISKSTKKRPARTEESILEDSTAQDVDQSLEENPVTAPARKRGRPSAKTNKSHMHNNQTSQKKDEAVFKKPQPIAKPNVKKQIPSKRDTQIQSIRESSVETIVDALGRPIKDRVETGSVVSSASRFARSNSVLRQHQPDQDEGLITTRTGRRSFRPVNWWANGRAEYNPEGELQDVIRAEFLDPPKQPLRKGKRKHTMKAIEEEEDEGDDWEILSGSVLGWDNATGVSTQEEEETEIAWSAMGVVPRDVAGAHFKYAKILGNPFFGAGIVELAVGGEKRSKNSRRMQMVFFVATGIVEVEVNDSAFTIHKGGIWQVPRGNFYAIKNMAQKTSRIFFAQACERFVDEEE